MQNAPEMRIATGGGLIHVLGIATASYYMVKNGYKLENPDWLTKKGLAPGIPDVYCSKTEKGVKRYYVIEIQSKECAKATREKYIQFEATTHNHHVVIINLDMGDKELNTLKEFTDYIEGRLP